MREEKQEHRKYRFLAAHFMHTDIMLDIFQNDLIFLIEIQPFS